MDRYDIELDLECEGGGEANKASLFGGMFKKSSKSISEHSQDNLDFDHTSSNGNLTENSSTKETGGNMFSGMFKKSPKPRTRKPSQDNLSVSSDLSGSQDSLSTNNNKEGGGIFGGMKKMFKRTQSRDDLSEPSEPTDGQDTENTKDKGGLFSGVFKNPKGAKTQSQEDLTSSSELSSSKEELSENSNTKERCSDSEIVDSGESHSYKQGTFAGAWNPFKTGHKSEKSVDLNDEDLNGESDKPAEHKQNDPSLPKDSEKREEAKQKTNNVTQWEKRDRSETILVANGTSEEEAMRASQNHKVIPKGAGDKQVKKELVTKERRPQSETPMVPPRPAPEEMSRKVTVSSENPEETAAKQGRLYPSLVKPKRPKHYNPFMPHTGVKLAAVETEEEATEEENVEATAQEENNEEESRDKTEAKANKPKRRNPFMPQVKAKVIQKRNQDGENEGGNRSIFDQLEDFRFEPSTPENTQDVDNLMEWWNTVDNWEDTPQTDDMTEKEEAKAFAVTADKIQKGIRVFNKLFSERAESLWQHVIDLNTMADSLDKFNKNTKIAQITGGSTSAIGGVATIAGLALAPVTMGTSLIVTAVGLGIATAGGLTSAGAGISNQVNNSMDRKKVEKIVEDYQEKMVDLNKALKFVKQGIENLRRFDLIKMRKHAYNRDFPVLNSNFYEDGAMAGKAILINANEIMRVVQIANVAGSTAARAVQIASMATGVLTGLFVGMDIYFVAKDSKELKKGAKSEFAAKIREVAQQLHEGLVELNSIREELQATKPENNQQGAEEEKKEYKYDDDEEEDEIDRIKKQMKKDYENREWV